MNSKATLPHDFETHLMKPLIGSAALRRKLRSTCSPSPARNIVDAMLKGCTPKTTPLYLRLIHAGAYWMMENHQTEALEAQIKYMHAVATQVKRFDLLLD